MSFMKKGNQVSFESNVRPASVHEPHDLTDVSDHDLWH